MAAPFSVWSDRIASADDAHARRQLLTEVLKARFGALGNDAASREATHAAARLYWLLNEKDRASGEVLSLLALCDKPGVGDGERREARELAKGMNVEIPPPRPAPREPRGRPERSGWNESRTGWEDRPPRPPRGEGREMRDGREPRPPREAPRAPRSPADAVRRARELALTGHWAEALEALPRGRDPEAVMLRAWAHIEAALAGAPEGREAAMRSVAADLRRALDLPRTEPAARSAGAPAVPEHRARPEPEERAPRVDADVADKALKAALVSGDEAAIEAAVAGFHRGWRALTSAESAIDSAAPGTIAALVRRVAGDQRMPEATTLLVKAAAGGDAPAAALLRAAPALGGPGAEVVVALARAARDGGCAVARVLRGVTAKERRDHGALGPIAERVEGLWRLLVRKGEARGEVWWVAEGTPEVRAAAPLIFLEDRFRVVVLGPDVAASGAFADAIPWTGAEGPAVAAALASWS